MKYQCEICGAVSSSETAMCEHEKECRTKHDNLFYCTEQLNRLIYLADTFKFGIVAEIPGEQEPNYYKITAAEFDGKKNRCILKVKNDEATPSADNKTKSPKRQS